MGFPLNYVVKLSGVSNENPSKEQGILCLLYYLQWFCDNRKNSMQNVKKYNLYSFGAHGENTQK
jgi:hypothetical protein